MSSNGNRKTILLTSRDKNVNALLKYHFPFHSIQYSCDYKGIYKPDYILSICQYNCVTEKCLKKAHSSLINPQALYIICRPVLGDYAGISKYGYWLSYMNNSFKEKLGSHLFYPSVPCIHRNVDILEVKKAIIESCGNINKISDIRKNSSAYCISQKLRNITGINLKTFQKYISLCHSLHDVYLSNISIKEIAFQKGLHPNAFRAAFVNRFNMSPSKVRKMREVF